MVEVSQLVVGGHGVQLVVFEVREEEAGQGQGVQVGVLELIPASHRRGADEARVKVGVVGNEQYFPARVGAFAHEIEEGLERLCLGGSVLHHIVGDARELHDLLGNGHLGVDEGVEGIQDLSILDLHRADLGHAAVLHRESRGLNIEDHRFPVHVSGAVAVEGGGGVVDEVGLHAPDDLLADLLGGEHGVLVGLDVAVVGDGDGLMPPLVGLLDQIRGGDDGVHGGHLGMDVQLHPLLLGLVLAGDLGNLGDGVVVEEEVGALGLVAAHLPLGVAPHGHHRAVGHHLADLVGILGGSGTPHLQGGGIVGDVEGDVEFIALTGGFLGKSKDLAQHHDVAHGLVDSGQGGGDDVKLTAHGVLGLGDIEVHEADPHTAVFHHGGLHRTASLPKKGLDTGEDLGFLCGLGGLVGLCLGGLALGLGHGILAVGLQDLLVHGGQPLGLALLHHGLRKVLGDLNADGNIQPEFAMQDAPHDIGGAGIADELDACLREGDAYDEGIFPQLVAVFTEKTPRHNADALGLLEELGDVVGRKQLCGVVGEEFDVVQPVGLGHLLLDAVQLVFFHKAGEIQLHLEGAVFLIGADNGVLRPLQNGAGG